MSYRAIFVSDVHITKTDDLQGRRFLAFLRELRGSRARETVSPVTHLFLLGDIFDLWIADHSVFVERFRGIISEIQRLISEGVEVHYFEGNHDLYLKPFWQDVLKVQVHPGPEHFVIGNVKVRAEHGDQIDKEDRGYKFLRWFLRTRVMKTIAFALPGWIVRFIGERASQKSRGYTQVRTDIQRILKLLHEHAELQYQKRPFDFIITGHVHTRDDFAFTPSSQSGLRKVRAINLGTWLEQPGYFELSVAHQRWVSIDA